MNKPLLISLILFLMISSNVYALSFQDVTNFFSSIFNSIASFFSSAFSVLTPAPTGSGGGGGGNGGSGGPSGPPSCSSSLSLSISGKDTCTITATVTSNNCINKTYEIKDEGSKCNGNITSSSFTKTCTWSVTSGSYTYGLYIDGQYKLSKTVTCSKTPPPTCSDGTLYGQCSSTKPKYCDNGNLVDKCSQCGCPTGKNCNSTTNSCYTPTPTCSDETLYGQCSSTKPKYCNSGTLINKCSQCGCPSGQSCNTTTGSCYTPSVSTCDSQCKSQGYNSGTCRTNNTNTNIPASPLHVEGNKIKDANGNVVYLRGVNKPQFESSADGWMGTTIWNDDRVKQELDIMKTWGINTIRMHVSVDLWKYDNITGSNTISDRTAIQRLVQLAAERGIYIVISGYSVYKYGNAQDALPYPPYQAVPEAQTVIANQQQFIDWWVDVASTLKSYPNVLIDIWNEPHGNLSTWFPTVQSVINALRANGLNNIVIVQKGWCASIDLSTPTNLWNDLSWITNNPLADPVGNIVYETHLYREYNHIIYSSPQKRQVYTLADIDTGFRLMKYYDIAAQYPLYIGEIGCTNDASDLDNERAFFANAFSLLNQHGISYTTWMWGDWTNDHLHTGAPAFTPTAAGTILQSYLLGYPSSGVSCQSGETSIGQDGCSSGVCCCRAASAYLSALDASKLQIAKIYPGSSSVLAFIEGEMGTIDAKRQILEYAVNRMHANAVMIMWRRQPSEYDSRDQLESPLNSGKLNPSYIKHLDEWVSLAEEYHVYVIFEEWFDPMLAKDKGEWTGFEDTTFMNKWTNFYRVLASHFAGKPNVAGFISGEDVIYNHTTEDWPWPSSGTTYFTNLWNQVQTNLSLAVHSADPNFNFIANPTMDWSGGFYTLGSKAMYPNVWQPLNDPNPHVLYRVMWNPGNWIKTDTHYPFDNSLLNGAINWHRETGIPITIECLVEWRETEAGGVWVWDSAGLQWMTDFLTIMKNEGIGLNMGEYSNGSAPYMVFDESGNERAWVGRL